MTSAGRKLELEVVDIENPKEYNFILGHGEAVLYRMRVECSRSSA
jgi:adenosine/AMP kinase